MKVRKLAGVIALVCRRMATRQPFNRGGSAEVMRAMDGRQSPGGEGDQLDDLSNPHEI